METQDYVCPRCGGRSFTSGQCGNCGFVKPIDKWHECSRCRHGMIGMVCPNCGHAKNVGCTTVAMLILAGLAAPLTGFWRWACVVGAVILAITLISVYSRSARIKRRNR